MVEALGELVPDEVQDIDSIEDIEDNDDEGDGFRES